MTLAIVSQSLELQVEVPLRDPTNVFFLQL